jgi:hypothetical protein
MMFDQQDAAAGLPDRLDERPEARDLVGGEASGGFVEEQEGRAQHECAGDLHEAELAVLQPVRALVRERLEADDPPRPTGTEAVYKIYAESFKDQAHLDAIVSEAREMVNAALGSPGPISA